jgi:hypothetical protein
MFAAVGSSHLSHFLLPGTSGTTGYLHTSAGFGTSDVSEALMRLLGGPKASVIGTARNWPTANKLLGLCDT